jgi:hypothetical protein
MRTEREMDRLAKIESDKLSMSFPVMTDIDRGTPERILKWITIINF